MAMRMNKTLKAFFSSPAYAVVGVSENREKWGNIAYRMLREKGMPVYPVNPHLTTVEGETCYARVTDLPDDVRSVVLVVPPHVTEQVVRECADKGITGVWMQPGAESPDAIAFAEARGMAVMYDACIMVMLSPVRDFAKLDQWLAKAVEAYD